MKLLDPSMRGTVNGLRIEEQQEIAAKQFPLLVAKSQLHYWRPGDPVANEGIRLLAGLAASYDLKDLRLADIVNDELKKPGLVHVDVFNLAQDCTDRNELRHFFPVLPPGYLATPIVGLWRDGIFESIEVGFDARRLVLSTIGSSVTAEESLDGLRPLDVSLLEEKRT